MSDIGHNQPPAHEVIDLEISDLEAEAANFLDGGPIETQGQADAIGVIIGRMRELKKRADLLRSNEKRPHDEAGKAVQAKWKPIIDRADLVVETAKRPITAWLAKQEAERAAEAKRLREEAIAAQEALLAKERAANPADLEAQQELKNERKAADIATAQANRAEKATVNVSGTGRAIGLRTHYVASVTDYPSFLRWLKEHRPDDLKAALDDLARTYCANGSRVMAGVLITEEKRAA